MAAKTPLSLVFAVPDHPWMKASDKAAVRIAMTVAEAGEREGVLAKVVNETNLNTDAPMVALETHEGNLRADLIIGADLASAKPLSSNEAISSRGVSLHGAGFIVTPEKAKQLGLGKVPGLDQHILAYRNGRDIASRPRDVMVIDLFPLPIAEVQARFPEVYQHVADTVKPERDDNNRDTYRDNWWIFGEPRRELRPVLAPLPRYITTIETAKHRFFQFLDASIRPDNMLVNFGSESATNLAVLSSHLHVVWMLAIGGTLEDRPRYNKSKVLDPFPFPDLSANPTIQSRLAELGERLDAFRKERLAAHDFLTMTGLYNVLERIRELDWKAGPGRHSESATQIEPLTDKERDIYDAGHLAILKDIHDEIDTLVFAAYGWSDLAPRLVGRPGATTPSPYKTDDQLAAEEELLTRLVALNQERAAEEARGLVRWLRPDYQIPKLGHKVARPDGVQQEADLAIVPASDKPKWPTGDTEQISVLVDLLRKAPAPVPSESLAASFDGRNTPKRRERIGSLLDTLTTIGLARSGQLEGQTRYFIPR